VEGAPDRILGYAAVVGIALGEVAVVLDVGARLFGCYVRTPLRAGVRAILVVGLAVLLALPLGLLAIDWESRAGRLLLGPFGLLGALLFVHFLFPYRYGIGKVLDRAQCTRVRELGGGVVLRDLAVTLDSLPGPAAGLTMLVVSDLHCNSRAHLDLIKECLARLDREEVDLVCMLGDFGEKRGLLDELVVAIAGLPARFGVFCVRGNHDFGGGRARILRSLLAENGVKLLDNRAYEIRDLGVLLVGLESPWVSSPLPEPKLGQFVLGLTHTPDNIAAFADLGAAFVVAGHTHGGFLRLPFIGPLFVPSRYGRFLDAGLFALRDTLMYVTPGVGYPSPVAATTPEIVRITLTGRR